MGTRRTRLDQRIDDQALSRTVNGHRKEAERARRDARMAELLAKAKYPYTPAIRSWLSAKLDKPSRLITEDEVKALLTKSS
jgi:hypothetical protein